MDDALSLTFTALVIPKLTSLLPRQEIPLGDWPHLMGIELADPSSLVPSQVDCILNVDFYAAVMLNGILPGPLHTPTAQNTKFGWVLFESTDAAANQSARLGMSHHVRAQRLESHPTQQFLIHRSRVSSYSTRRSR